jgi:hypothetical protein
MVTPLSAVPLRPPTRTPSSLSLIHLVPWEARSVRSRIVCRQPSVVSRTQSVDPAVSRRANRRDYRNRGKGIASPDQPREPKQSWRPQGPTGLDVRDHDRAPSLLNPDSELAGSRSCVGRDRTDGRRDLDQVATARLGRSGHLIAAAISAAPFRPEGKRLALSIRGPSGCTDRTHPGG